MQNNLPILVSTRGHGIVAWWTLILLAITSVGSPGWFALGHGRPSTPGLTYIVLVPFDRLNCTFSPHESWHPPPLIFLGLMSLRTSFSLGVSDPRFSGALFPLKYGEVDIMFMLSAGAHGVGDRGDKTRDRCYP